MKFLPHRVNFDVTQFATQFTYICRQYRAQNRQHKFKFRKNCFEFWSLIGQNMAKYVHNINF